MSEILDFKNMKKLHYENRAITVKHSLLPTSSNQPYSLLIKVVNDRMYGKIALAHDMVFSVELEMPLTGEREVDAAEEMEQNLIQDLCSAVLEREYPTPDVH